MSGHVLQVSEADARVGIDPNHSWPSFGSHRVAQTVGWCYIPRRERPTSLTYSLDGLCDGAPSGDPNSAPLEGANLLGSRLYFGLASV